VTRPRYLGIDAGGTKTVALAGDGRRVRGRGTAGPANPSLVGIEEALAALGQAAHMALAEANGSDGDIAVAWIGGAGAWPASGELRARAAQAVGAARVEVSHDGRLLLAAAGIDEGVALVAGTGSSAYGRDRTGTEVAVGGWGHLLGDEGSGYDIARAAMRAVTRAIDGRGPHTALVAALLRTTGTANPGELRTSAYPAPPTDEVAAFARAVLDCAAAGDAVAATIVADAGAELAALCTTAAASLRIAPPCRIVAGGGLLTRGSPLLDAVARHLAALIDHALTTNDTEPAAGALALARQAGKEDQRKRHDMDQAQPGEHATTSTKGGTR
jgi:N-acetylglucosamine kinase-like BadF-type ATPase